MTWKFFSKWPKWPTVVCVIKDIADIYSTVFAKIDMKQHENTCFSSCLRFLWNKSRSSCIFLFRSVENFSNSKPWPPASENMRIPRGASEGVTTKSLATMWRSKWAFNSLTLGVTLVRGVICCKPANLRDNIIEKEQLKIVEVCKIIVWLIDGWATVRWNIVVTRVSVKGCWQFHLQTCPAW